MLGLLSFGVVGFGLGALWFGLAWGWGGVSSWPAFDLQPVLGHCTSSALALLGMICYPVVSGGDPRVGGGLWWFLVFPRHVSIV